MIPTSAQGQVSAFYCQSDPFTLVWTVYIKRWLCYIVATSYRVFPHIDTTLDTLSACIVMMSQDLHHTHCHRGPLLLADVIGPY